MALASGSQSYTPPVAIREMESRMAAFPKRWAEEGDEVLTDWGVSYAELQARHPDSPLTPVPWGWSLALKCRLLRWGVPSQLLPADETLAAWRELSNRKFATRYLQELIGSTRFEEYGDRLEGGACRFFTSAESFCREMGNTLCPIQHNGLTDTAHPSCDRGDSQATNRRKMIFKSPWSSSGRGVFVTNDPDSAKARIEGYARRQGGFVADIYYNKVLDCALEFSLDRDGQAAFLGYSVFEADRNGHYKNHYVEAQSALRSRIVSALGFPEAGKLLGTLVDYHRHTLQEKLGGRYCGPLGIDMMACEEGGKRTLHPCLEINLRMNMGIVAILLHRRNPQAPAHMLF